MTTLRERVSPRTGGGAKGFRGLLRGERQPGYPVEYLLTRLRGRRGNLIANWRGLVYAPDLFEALAASRYQGFAQESTIAGMWLALAREHVWVFRQMDEGLRRTFAPYFFHAELRTFLICLRSLAGEKPGNAGEALATSLLSGPLAACLRKGGVDEALQCVEEELIVVSPRFRGITAVFRESGLRTVEQELAGRTIAAIVECGLHRVMRQFFIGLVDSRNILTLYAVLRAGSSGPAAYLPGGTILPEDLRSLQEKEDLFAVLPLVKRAAGISLTDPTLTQVETALYRGMTRFARSEGRDPLGEGLVLDYLWRCSLEVTNLGLLLAGKDLDRELIGAELV